MANILTFTFVVKFVDGASTFIGVNSFGEFITNYCVPCVLLPQNTKYKRVLREEFCYENLQISLELKQ